WLRLIHCFSDRLTVMFFGARLMSTVLLVVTLCLVHATLRRLGCRSFFAQLLTACIGLFPLTTMIAASIQPDNLSFTLVSLVFYLAITARRAPANQLPLFGLGLSLGALFVTKQHCFLAAAVPTVAMLISLGISCRYGPGKWLRMIVVLTAPIAVLGSIYYWTIWGLDYHP